MQSQWSAPRRPRNAVNLPVRYGASAETGTEERAAIARVGTNWGVFDLSIALTDGTNALFDRNAADR